MASEPDSKPDHDAGTPRETAHIGAWVGRRVVVRSFVPGERGPTGGPALTDAVGIVEAADETAIVVRRHDGTIRRIPTADVLIVKGVPPPPPPRRGDRQPPEPEPQS
jgi:hypothetical protein